MVSQRASEILAAYEDWDPEMETTTELVARLGISRQRLYEVLANNNVVPKSRRRTGPSVPGMPGELIGEIAENALEYLLQQLIDAREELARLRRQNGH